jgi:uncharacterized membrane protein YqjE
VENEMNHAENNHTARSLADIVAEIKQELKDFVETRITMLKSELRDKVAHWKLALPLGAAGAILLVTAYFLIVASLVALAAVFINSPYRWFFALLGVAVLWSLLGGIAVYVAVREFAAKRLMPEKTIEVLKGDKLWLQKEARNQI